MVGERFGRLVVAERAGKDKFSQTLWRCICDCGNEITTNTNRLKMGKTKSCGCLKKEGNNKRHGDCYKRLNGIYRKMKTRCYTPGSPRYADYGGRGIIICDEWLGNDGYIHFRDWALNNGYKDDLSIDRIDNNRGYEPDNCRWIDAKTQNRNTRRNVILTVEGVSKTIAEWSEETGIAYAVILQRVKKLGWTHKDAVTKEVQNG